MKRSDLLSSIPLGEDSRRQFKANVRNGESLASEMAAFANSNGGTILIGVADDGSTPGLSQKDVARINQFISNAASQLVRSPLTVQTENVARENGRIVIVSTVPKGIDKLYFDKNRVIWLKTGADERRVDSREELHRLSQDMKLPTDDGNLNLAGVLMFAEQPERIEPQFVVNTIRPGHLPNILTVEKLKLADNDALKGQGAVLSCQPDPAKKSFPDNVLKRADHNVGKASGKILETCRERSAITIPELAALIGIIERSVQRNIQKLQADGLLLRVGGRKAGHREVPE